MDALAILNIFFFLNLGDFFVNIFWFNDTFQHEILLWSLKKSGYVATVVINGTTKCEK